MDLLTRLKMAVTQSRSIRTTSDGCLAHWEFTQSEDEWTMRCGLRLRSLRHCTRWPAVSSSVPHYWIGAADCIGNAGLFNFGGRQNSRGWPPVAHWLCGSFLLFLESHIVCCSSSVGISSRWTAVSTWCCSIQSTLWDNSRSDFSLIVHSSLHAAYNNTDQRFTRINGVYRIEKVQS